MALSAVRRDAAASPFGALLRQWRRARGVSQLQLASRAGSTSRHISFLETGRSRPSRAMVLRLAEELAVPLRDRNQLLQAAGLAPAYPHAAAGAAELEPYQRAVDRLLAAHEPFPGLVMDRYSTVLAANRPAALLFGPGLVGVNLAERYLDDTRLRQAIVNWPEVAQAALARLRRQLHQAPLDERLHALVERAEAAVAGLPPAVGAGQHHLVACPCFRIGDTVIRTIVMAARFDTALDVTLDELRIELVYPEDATAEHFFRTAAEQPPSLPPHR